MPPLKITSRDQLLSVARDRGERWGVYFFRERQAGFPRNNFPPMTERVIELEAYQRVADILPIDAFGEALVQACYEAARDSYKEQIKAWREAGDLASVEIKPVLKR